MSETANVALIRDIYASFGRGDIALILGKLASDVLWEGEGPSIIPFNGVLRGPAEVAFFFEAISQTMENIQMDMANFVASGDKVVVLGRYAATIKQTGRYVTTWLVHYWEVRDGQVALYRNFTNTAALAEAYS